jgi:glucosamine--fructose-6-phosphate aminotransferase (isomerizing)
VAKEIGIYRAHKAAPIVIATAGAAEYPAALAVLEVPTVHPALAFVLSAMVGHLFGYAAALAIDAQALPLREARAALEAVASPPAGHVLDRLADALDGPADRFLTGLRSGAFDGHLEASTAMRIDTLLRYGRGQLPLDVYVTDFGTVGTPGVVFDALTAALTEGIDQLTRPIDAIKHQAKTVTVGISRSEEDFAEVGLVRATIAAGAPRDSLGYRSLRTLAALEAAVSRVVGHTRYMVEGDVTEGSATITVLDKGGIAVGMVSQADRGTSLRGTKNRAARQREVTAAVGRDGRTIVLVPETKGNEVTGLTLLHVELRDRLDPAAMAAVLDGYQGRLDAVVDAVTESEPEFRQEVLGEVAVVDLLTVPVHVLAAHWRQT